MTGAPYPVFPVKLVGVEELHAAFLNESRTRGTLWDRVQEIRVSARFWTMWDSTALDRHLSRSTISYTLNSERSRSVESHISRKTSEMWGTHPLLRIQRVT